jgi:PIN domain nuclease of toxin-antitoxin system
MTEYVLDTHALLWHLHAPRRLGAAAREALVRVDQGEARAWLPAVVIAESLMVTERRRIEGLTLESLLHQLDSFRDADNYRLSSLTPDTVLAAPRLAAIPDIFDRLVVAEALERDLPLVTRDEVIRTARVVETIWD